MQEQVKNSKLDEKKNEVVGMSDEEFTAYLETGGKAVCGQAMGA